MPTHLTPTKEKPQEFLWNMSTSIREASRIPDFLAIAQLLDNQTWDLQTQEHFQMLLIQYRKYLNREDTLTFNNLSEAQIACLKNKNYKMTFAEAEGIFRAKKYKDPPMRGRQSMNPLQKLGLVHIVDKTIHISEVGRKLLNKEMEWEEFLLDSLLKFQLPNPQTKGYSSWNSKPFINTLRLIKKVNELCTKEGKKAKGIATDEFGIFALSLRNYEDVDHVAKLLMAYRKGYESMKEKNFTSWQQYDQARKRYKENYILSYLKDFKNPIKNVDEYADSMKRYLRQTKYIRILGAYTHQYIDIEPRRSVEIDSILQADKGDTKTYTAATWNTYMGTYGAYPLPFERVDKLQKIFSLLIKDIHDIEHKLKLPATKFTIPTQQTALKTAIKQARTYRFTLQNNALKIDYQTPEKIVEVLHMLKNIATHNMGELTNKPALELEKWSNIALHVLNDALSIKPNAPMGDDNEPTFTAPANVADIECYYEKFNAICEVTMLKGRDQWYNEGQPVMRHLRDFENVHKHKPCYCLFVAPQIHKDTRNTYWTANKYEYEGEKQKIIPITITQFMDILSAVRDAKIKGNAISHYDIATLYDACAKVDHIKNSKDWSRAIQTQIVLWMEKIIQK